MPAAEPLSVPVEAATMAQHIVPHHQARARLPARHMGVAEPDDDARRLDFALVAHERKRCAATRRTP